MVSDNAVLAGWASVDITPDIPCRMGGYGARTEPANAIHDPLYASALAIGTTEQPFVLIVCDCIAVDASMTQEVRRRITKSIRGATVWLSATHTHSGPFISHALSIPPETLQTAAADRLIAGAAKAAEEAVAQMHHVDVRWASGAIKGVASNRDHPENAADIALDLLSFYDVNEQIGEPLAIFGSFPCHPTVLSASNLAISADLPGAFRRQMHEILGVKQASAPMIALATGAAGDISTRHTRQGQGFEELERLGSLLAEQAYGLLAQARQIRLALPRIQTTGVAVEAKDALPEDELAAYTSMIERSMQAARQVGKVAEARTLETALQGLQVAQKRAMLQEEGMQEDTNSLEVAVATLGEVAFAAVPGELYNRIGAELRQGAKGALLFLGYTNGYVGYIPTREAYNEMDYEVLMSPFAPGTAERLGEALNAMLTRH
jgi:neutral ceramidase